MKFTILKRIDAYKAITAINEEIQKPEFKGLEIRIEAVKESKTLQQIKYLHDIIADYLTPILYDKGNIETNSVYLAKIWLKEHCGFGEIQKFKFKNQYRNIFMPKSFADASKKELSDIIEEVARICAFAEVVLPETKKYKE